MSDSASHSVFSQIATQLERHGKSFLDQPIKIDSDHYERFCYSFLFDSLRGLTFGQAFCKEFFVYDALLLYSITDEDEAKRYIAKAGYIETQIP
jgi:hypothetical protein